MSRGELTVVVDLDVCQAHGECCRTAPDLFELDSELVVHWDRHPGDSREVEVRRAAAACPVAAITVHTGRDDANDHGAESA